MGGISYVAHVSNGKSAITTKRKLEGVAKHNLRKYKSDEYSAEKINRHSPYLSITLPK